MGKFIFQNSELSFKGMNTDSLNNKFLPFIKALPFDVVIYSTFRDIEKQTKLYNEYLKKLADYNNGIIKEKPSVVNRPGNSAHNWGYAVDMHPVSMKDSDYDIMLLKSKEFDLKRDKNERWHFQDNIVSFEKMALWLSENQKRVFPIGMILIFILTISLLKHKGII